MGSITEYVGWSTVFGSVIAYFGLLALYRLLLHPLARFPGPKLAAISRWYEAYYDVIQGGQYTSKIAELHSIYGPIIRISPHEIHVIDPAFFDTLYRTEGHWDKYAWSYDAFGAKGSTFGGWSHEAHKVHRKAVAPFFSKPNVTAREHLLVRNTDKLCARISEHAGTDMDVGAAMSAVARDNANNYIIDKDYDELDKKDFGIGLSYVSQGAGFIWRTSKHIPWFGPVIKAIPLHWILKVGGPSTRNFVHHFLKSEQDTRDILAAASSDHSDSKEQPTMIHAIIQSNLPPADKKFTRIFEEVAMVTGAAFETAANILRLTVFHVYTNEHILRQLRSEIQNALINSPGPLTWKRLEQLPYLTAVLTEGMRLSPGISTRMARITDKDLFYKSWRIPAGTPVGMTAILMHTDEELYPDPMRFDPNRWLGENTKASAAATYAPFSRGTRNCLGLHFAWAEMYYVIAALVQEFDLTIKGATAGDFEMISDNFAIGTKAGCNLVAHVSPSSG